ncbi:MAG: SDR family NAD(P)-dependent oxidoreductase [Bdellovibrionota bacterium]
METRINWYQSVSSKLALLLILFVSGIVPQILFAAPGDLVVITGGTSGIGLELVRTYYRAGYKVVTLGRSTEKLENLRKEFPDESRLITHQVDVTNGAQLTEFVDNVFEKLGTPKIWINNHGIPGPFGKISNATSEQIRSTIDTNLTSNMLLASIVLSKTEEREEKITLINVSSGSAKGGVPGTSAYATSKSALNTFVATIQTEYPQNHIFSFNPGHVDTNMQAQIRSQDTKAFPLAVKMAELHTNGNLVNPKDSAREILYLSENPTQFRGGEMVDYREAEAQIRLANPPWKNAIPDAALVEARQALEQIYGKKLQRSDLILTVDGIALKSPKNINDLFVRLQEFLIRIEKSPNEVVKIQIANSKFEIERKSLGSGLTGIVFKIHGKNNAIKLPLPHPLGIKSLMEEISAIEKHQALLAAGLETPRSIRVNKMGLFSLKELAPSLTLTQLMMEAGLIRVNAGNQVERVDASKLATLNTPEVKAIRDAVAKAIEARKQFPELRLDLGPDNFHVEKKSDGSLRLILVDIGASGNSTKEKLDRVSSFSDYLDFSSEIVARYIKTGVYRAPVNKSPEIRVKLQCVQALR